jgi:hypothetical protein
MAWIKIDAMEEEWKRAQVYATRYGENQIDLHTENVAALTISFPPGSMPANLERNFPAEEVGRREPQRVFINGSRVDRPNANTDWSLVVHLAKVANKWTVSENEKQMSDLHKHHGLQGPIDDAFWDSFLFVTPSGPALNPAVEKWVGSELPRAVREWQKQFRGDAPQKKDTEIKDDDIAKNNLVLWGDPSSNAILKKIGDKLPIKWTADGIEVGGKKYSAGEHVPVLIYPNPLNPAKYVVLNSGFTYREYDYLNNARQVPKLPDWAIVNLSEPPNAVSPGKVVAADFFDEQWKLKPVK